MSLRKLRVVRVTKNLEDYPDCRQDTEEFPFLVKFIQDEAATFIVDESDGCSFWPADEFFLMTNIKEIMVDPSKLV